MKTHDTFPGRSYSVHTSAGCTVSDDSGWSKELAAPEDYFTAHSGKVYVSDDSASVKELFKLAPYQKLRLLGVVGGDKLPVGYTRMEYLESSGTQYIYLDGEFTSTAAWSFSFTPTKIYTNNYFCGRNENYYAFAKIDNGLVAIGHIPKKNPVGFKPSTQEVYTVNFDMLNRRGFISCRGEKKEWKYETILATKALVLFGGQSTNQDTVGAVNYKSNAKMWDIAVSDNGEQTHEFIPALDSTGAPCMFDTVTRKPFYNSGKGAFVAGIETQAQLDTLILKLPDRTGLDVGTLQVRLSETLQTPENEAKLDAMLAKNWEITQAA